MDLSSYHLKRSLDYLAKDPLSLYENTTDHRLILLAQPKRQPCTPRPLSNRFSTLTRKMPAFTSPPRHSAPAS